MAIIYIKLVPTTRVCGAQQCSRLGQTMAGQIGQIVRENHHTGDSHATFAGEYRKSTVRRWYDAFHASVPWVTACKFIQTKTIGRRSCFEKKLGEQKKLTSVKITTSPALHVIYASGVGRAG